MVLPGCGGIVGAEGGALWLPGRRYVAMFDFGVLHEADCCHRHVAGCHECHPSRGKRLLGGGCSIG